MWSYHVLVFLPALFCLITDVSPHTCQLDDFVTVQKMCRDPNDNLLQAEHDHDDKLLCKYLYELWYCVAENVARCLHNFTELYTRYTHSPHNCQLSQEQLVELQRLVLSHGGDNEEVEVKPLTEPDSPTTSSSEGATTEDNVKGDAKGHTFNRATKLCFHRLPLVFISWLVAVRVTSFPFAS